MSDIAATVIASLIATSVGSVIFPELPEAFKVGMGALIAARGSTPAPLLGYTIFFAYVLFASHFATTCRRRLAKRWK